MKHRPLMSFEAALSDLLQQVGHAYAAEEIDVSESLLRKWSDPDQPQRPNLQQAVHLDVLYLALRRTEPEEAPLVAAWLRHLRAPNVTPSAARALESEMLDVTACVGALADELRKAQEDGTLSAREKEALRQAIAALRREIDELVVAIDHAH